MLTTVGAGLLQPVLVSYMGLSKDTTEPNVADTALAFEISLLVSGYNRSQATTAVVVGATTYTITASFTPAPSDQTPITFNKFGLFTALSGGVMFLENYVWTPWNTVGMSIGANDEITIVVTVPMPNSGLSDAATAWVYGNGEAFPMWVSPQTLHMMPVVLSAEEA